MCKIMSAGSPSLAPGCRLRELGAHFTLQRSCWWRRPQQARKDKKQDWVREEAASFKYGVPLPHGFKSSVFMLATEYRVGLAYRKRHEWEKTVWTEKWVTFQSCHIIWSCEQESNFNSWQSRTFIITLRQFSTIRNLLAVAKRRRCTRAIKTTGREAWFVLSQSGFTLTNV